jgi:uncharacterized membrane protein HdeD (DUF308 family)
VLFALLALLWPGATLAALVVLFDAYTLVDGLLRTHLGVRWQPPWRRRPRVAPASRCAWYRGRDRRIHLVRITAVVLLLVVAAWSVAISVLQIIAAIQLRREIANEWFLALGGAASVLFGIYVFTNPGAGALALVWLIGLYAFVFGITLIAIGFRLRGHRGDSEVQAT